MDVDELEYKRLVEARLANNEGSNYVDVFLVTSVLVPATILACLVQNRFQLSKSSWFARTLLEGLCIAVPMLGTVTSDSLATSATWLAVTTLLVGVLCATGAAVKPMQENSEVAGAAANSQSAFFSRFRSSLMMLTIVSILAVDFTVFPKRFMKTELFGVSLMDTGVGSFVFSAGVALGGKLARQGQTDGKTSTGFGRQWLGSSIPLIVLGSIRFIMCWGVDYHEHVTEYGKHWNFFFTLAVLPVWFVVLETVLRWISLAIGAKQLRTVLVAQPILPAFAFTFLYQAAIQAFDLVAFVEESDRSTIFKANKEGILSSFGYMGIYLLGASIGRLLLKASPSTSGPSPTAAAKRLTAPRRRNTHLALGVGTLLWFLLYWSDTFVQPCSRRLCNATYVLFIAALNTTFLGLFSLVDPLCQTATQTLLDAVNRNQLALFLVANVSTGIVNVSMRTIFAPPLVSYIVLGIYLLEVSLIAGALNRFGITLKAW